MAEEFVGTVTHYFAKPAVAVLDLTASVRLGDVLHFSGHGADFQQSVGSLQIDHAAVETASPGIEVAIQVDQRVREGTQVFRVT